MNHTVEEPQPGCRCFQCGEWASAISLPPGGGACLQCISGYPAMFDVLPHVWGQKSTRIKRAKNIIDGIRRRL